MPIIDKIPDNNINSEEYIRIMAQSNVEFGNLNCNNIYVFRNWKYVE